MDSAIRPLMMGPPASARRAAEYTRLLRLWAEATRARADWVQAA
ncbi:hypothetical protein [Streptomyces palmae]|nr:hypothetical protein [Streptomyces palmae]